ncbi:MAG: ABC transporter substrate-binding protein [Christensenellaceae bacterium]
MKKLMTVLIIAAMVLMILGGCNSNAPSPQKSQTPTTDNTQPKGSADTIKIGVLVPLTGAFAALGVDGMEGVKMAFEEADYTINGKKVELFFEDTAADPDLCIQKVSRLVEREGVDIILGPLSGGEATALKDYAPNIPDTTIIVAGAASEDVTMRGVPDNIFRTAYTGAQTMFAFGDFAYKELGYKKIVTLAEDYDFPFSQVGGFLLNYIRSGGEVLNRLWVNVGTTDYSSIIAQIPSDADAIYVALGGSDAINFINQFHDYGIDLPILGGSITIDTTILNSEAGHLLEGVYAGSHYAQVLPYPEFETFDKSFSERFDRASSLFAADYYIGSQVAIKAMNAVKGDLSDVNAFRSEILKVKYDSPRGPFSFDEFHNVIENVYITQVQKVDGQLRNVVYKTYDNQTQFGPYDPDWYQSQPSYDRVNPTEETIKGAKLAS